MKISRLGGYGSHVRSMPTRIQVTEQDDRKDREDNLEDLEHRSGPHETDGQHKWQWLVSQLKSPRQWFSRFTIPGHEKQWFISDLHFAIERPKTPRPVRALLSPPTPPAWRPSVYPRRSVSTPGSATTMMPNWHAVYATPCRASHVCARADPARQPGFPDGTTL